MTTITVSVELTLKQARILRTFCSVGRHYDNILSVLDKIDTSNNEELEQDIIYIEDNIKMLKPVLNELHHQLRDKLEDNPDIKILWDVLR